MRDDLPARIEAYHALPAEALGDEARAVFDELIDALESGEARAAEPSADGWRVNGWVKKGILLGFRLGRIVATEPAGPLSFVDKDTFLPRRFAVGDGVRVVPGGTAVRHGAHVGTGVIIMPPAYVNVGRLRRARAASSTPTPSSAPARRSASACTSRRPPSSAACSSRWGRCPSSSRTTCSWAATAACTKGRSWAAAPCWARA